MSGCGPAGSERPVRGRARQSPGCTTSILHRDSMTSSPGASGTLRKQQKILKCLKIHIGPLKHYQFSNNYKKLICKLCCYESVGTSNNPWGFREWLSQISNLQFPPHFKHSQSHCQLCTEVIRHFCHNSHIIVPPVQKERKS